MKKLVLIGDSIRMGYQEGVRKALQSRAEIWAPTENGGESGNVLAHLEEWILGRQPDLVHLNCGLHDLKKPLNADQPNTTLDRYATNLRTIFREIRAKTSATLVWVTTTPVNEVRHHEVKGFDRLEKDVAAYNAVALRVAEEFELPVNDLYRVVMKAGRDTQLCHDGVHYTPEGYALLAKAVADFLKPRL